MSDREILQPKNWILQEYDDLDYQETKIKLEERIQILESRERVLKIFTILFAVALFLSFLAVFLKGFSIRGFSLETSTIDLLVKGIIAEVAVLLGIGISWLYSHRK